MKQGDARSGDPRSAAQLRAALIVAQTAFAVVLLIAAGLILQTFLHLRAVDPGFRGEQVLTLRTALPMPRYEEASRRSAFFAEVLDRVQALPGVTAAGYTSWLPLAFPGGAQSVRVEGRTDQPAVPANYRLVTPDYFRAMGMTLVRGRFLTGDDLETTEPVAVINETMARQYWSTEDPMGRRFRAACQTCPWLRVVGIAGDVHQEALGADVRPEFWQPFAQNPEVIPFLLPKDLAIRVAGDPTGIVAAVRAAIWDVDSRQPIDQVRVLSDYREADLAPQRFQARLLGAFAGLALLLASLGVYGVLAYVVAQRYREIGLRVALGAQPRQLVQWVVARGLRPVFGGLALGLVAAYALAELIARLLYGVEPRDVTTFALATSTLLGVALLASWLPAYRAATIDAAAALRCQ